MTNAWLIFCLECESDLFFFLLVEERNKCGLGLRITNAELNAAGCKDEDNLVPASQVLPLRRAQPSIEGAASGVI